MWVLGFDLHLIKTVLVFFSFWMVFFNGLIENFEKKLPLFLIEAFRYGKTLDGPVKTGLISLITVPKSWFLHFYIFSSIYVPCLLYLAYQVYVNENAVPGSVHYSLDLVCTQSRQSNTEAEAAVLVLMLLSLQCLRRLYECAFVNAKSKSTMNVLHYVVGFTHYFCAGTGVLCEAPSFTNRGPTQPWDKLKMFDVKNALYVLMFFMAWLAQFRTHKIFSSLKQKNSSKHGIPHGGLFQYVSCPHYLCEVVIYFSLMMILGVSHQTMLFLFMWVLSNQTVAALMSHSWYVKTFSQYPQNRRAIFPYML